MASIFNKIISGEIPAHKIYEDEKFLVFLDAFPLVKGHTLVIPKVEIDKFYDVEDALFQELMLLSKKISVAIEKAIPCLRVGLSIVGLEVPHCHIHLVPLNQMKDLDFTQERLKLSSEEFKQLAEKIAKAL